MTTSSRPSKANWRSWPEADLVLLLAHLRSRTEKPEYVARGAASALRDFTGSECVLSGPAGTGKTRGCLEHLHSLALAHPKSRGLITRLTRISLTQTALVTLTQEVRPDLAGAVWRATEQEWRYPNGSVVAVAGLDKEGQRVFSGQYDHIYINEATELPEPAWENLTTRLRNGRSPRQQIFGDTNPDRPGHWLTKRCESGRCLMLESRHEDNPRLFDGKDWTAEGVKYLGRLDALTGPRLLRLRHGRWVQSEGVVYPDWDPAVHLVGRFDIPDNWPRIWSIDFGYTNAFCCLWGALDGDGRLYIYRQVYHSKRLVSDHAARLQHLLVRDVRPRAIVADPEDREGRETLSSILRMSTIAADKLGKKRLGIQYVQARLRKAGDGRPRLFVLRDSLDERDAELVESKRPTCLEEEIDGYVWDERLNEEPAINQDDHAMDALRYLVYALDCPTDDEEDDVVTVIHA